MEKLVQRLVQDELRFRKEMTVLRSPLIALFPQKLVPIRHTVLELSVTPV
jgi:hypothetical protein